MCVKGAAVSNPGCVKGAVVSIPGCVKGAAGDCKSKKLRE